MQNWRAHASELLIKWSPLFCLSTAVFRGGGGGGGGAQERCFQIFAPFGGEERSAFRSYSREEEVPLIYPL